MTPTEVTTSVMMWRPSATRAGERSARPVRIRSCAQTRLITDATPLMARPGQGCSSVRGHCPGAPDFDEDQQRCDDDQHAFEHGREILGLVVAERVILVGRRVADADRPEGGGGGDHVDGQFQRVGIKRDRAGHLPGQELQAEHDEGDDDRPEGEPRDLLLRRGGGGNRCQIRQPFPWPCAADGRRCSRSSACRRSGRAS